MFNRKLKIKTEDTDIIFINKGSRLIGTIDCPNTLTIAGDYDRMINTKYLEITDTGRIKGTINVETLTIAGNVEANIKCTGRLKIVSLER